MKLKEKINADYISAFKAKDSIGKSILSVVKGEIQTLEKNQNVPNLTDEDIVKILTKISKSLVETIEASNDVESKLQLEVVNRYLPKRMSEEDVIEKINNIMTKNPSFTIGDMMKSFANDQVDRKMVAKLFNQVKQTI